MGGGAGTRLFPLTKDRSKPAVPLGGKYRLVDIPISNCLNSGLRSIYVLTQFNTHVAASPHPGELQVRQFFAQLRRYPRRATNAGALQLVSGHGGRGPAKHALFSGAAVRLLHHPERRSALPDGLPRRCCTSTSARARTSRSRRNPSSAHQASEFGIMQSDSERRITRFVEKPKEEAILDELKLGPELLVVDRVARATRSCSRRRWVSTFSIATCSWNVSRTIWWISGSTSSRMRSRSGTSAPTFSMATGRTSGRSAPSTMPISI